MPTAEQQGAVRWRSDLGQSNKFEAVSLAVCPNAVVAVAGYQQRARSQPQWFVEAFNAENGRPYFRQPLRGEPLPEGLLVDKDGQIVVTMLDGRVLCYTAGQGRPQTDRARDRPRDRVRD